MRLQLAAPSRELTEIACTTRRHRRLVHSSALERLRRTSTRNDEPMAFMDILECADRSLYVGSTKNLDLRLAQHQSGEGAVYTRSRRPVRLLYFEEYLRVDEAFAREKQVQGWGRAKRLALV